MWLLFSLTGLFFSIILSVKARYESMWQGELSSIGETEYEYLIRTQKAKTVDVLLGLSTMETLELAIKPEKWWDKLAKNLGISAEYQVGQPEFDDDLYLISNNPALCQTIGQSEKLQKAISYLNFDAYRMGFKFKGLYIRKAKLWIRLSPHDKTAPTTLSSLAETLLPYLMSVNEVLKEKLETKNVDLREPYLAQTILLSSISTGLFINGIVTITKNIFVVGPYIVDQNALIKTSLIFGTVVILGLIALTILLLGRTAKTHFILFELVLFGYFGAVTTTYSITRIVNNDFGTSSGEILAVEVLGSRVSSGGKGPPQYYLVLKDWTHERSSRDLRVTHDTYKSTPEGSIVRLYQKPGVLGFRVVSNLLDEDAYQKLLNSKP